MTQKTESTSIIVVLTLLCCFFFEADGTFLAEWGGDIFQKPHGIWISPADEIYTTDTIDHTVRKFTSDGQLLQTFGTVNRPGAPDTTFNEPTRAVLSTSGELYISGGYGQSRGHRINTDGEVIISWGSPGPGSGELNLPHDVTVHCNNYVYIPDRRNHRCQIFSNTGEFLTQWTGLRSPNDLFIDEDGIVHIAEGGRRITLMTLDDEGIGRWGEEDNAAGQFSHSPHGIWIDSIGDLYVSDVGFG